MNEEVVTTQALAIRVQVQLKELNGEFGQLISYLFVISNPLWMLIPVYTLPCNSSLFSLYLLIKSRRVSDCYVHATHGCATIFSLTHTHTDVKVKLDAAMMEKNMIERELQTRTEKWDEELKVTRSESDGYRNRVAVLEQNEESARWIYIFILCRFIMQLMTGLCLDFFNSNLKLNSQHLVPPAALSSFRSLSFLIAFSFSRELQPNLYRPPMLQPRLHTNSETRLTSDCSFNTKLPVVLLLLLYCFPVVSNLKVTHTKKHTYIYNIRCIIFC